MDFDYFGLGLKKAEGRIVMDKGRMLEGNIPMWYKQSNEVPGITEPYSDELFLACKKFRDTFGFECWTCSQDIDGIWTVEFWESSMDITLGIEAHTTLVGMQHIIAERLKGAIKQLKDRI